MRRVKINPITQCWEWTGSTKGQGYGLFAIDGHPHSAHRVSYEEFNGPIPDGMMVCHECDNRLCINPTHLWLGTALDNVRDMIEKGRARFFGRPQPSAEIPF